MTGRLDALIGLLDQVRADAAGAAEYGFSDPWPVFLRRMRLLTPQSYGTRIQNRFAAERGLQVVPASLDRGDVVDGDGGHWEVKASMVTATNRQVNVVQIRPWQDIVGYHVLVATDTFELVHLQLSKAQMAAELDLIGSNAHGTDLVAQANTHREYAIRFPWTPDDGESTAARWVARYAVDAPASLRPALPRPVQPQLFAA